MSIKFIKCAAHGAPVPFVDGVALCSINVGVPHLPKYLRGALRVQTDLTDPRVWHCGVAESNGGIGAGYQVEVYALEGSPVHGIVVHLPVFKRAVRFDRSGCKKIRTYEGQ